MLGCPAILTNPTALAASPPASLHFPSLMTRAQAVTRYITSGKCSSWLYVANKSNEISAILHLIEVLALSGQIITLDAMGTHTHIVDAIIEKKADYILALKGNQGNLHKEAYDQFYFAHRNVDLPHSEGWSYDQRIDKSNGRIVTRTVTVNHLLDWMDGDIRGKWRDLRCLIHVETQPTQLDSDEVRREIRYYISSLNEPASIPCSP